MYDMYRWDQAAPAPARRRAPDGRPRPGTAPRTLMPNGAARPVPAPAQAARRGRASARPLAPGGATGPAAQALQVALDRRDNGGDPATPADQ